MKYLLPVLVLFCLPVHANLELVPKPANPGYQGDGQSYGPSASEDGRYVVFTSYASNLVANDTNRTSDVFLLDRQNDTLVRVNQGLNGTEASRYSSNAVISANGRYIVYESSADNLVIGDGNNRTDIFLYDIQTGNTTRVSEVAGTGGNSYSKNPAISAGGRYIVYESSASNLVAGDNNNQRDIFLHDIQTDTTTRISEAGNSGGNGGSYKPVISADGRYIAYISKASNLVADDSNNQPDIFLYDAQTGITVLVGEVTDLTQNPNNLLRPAISPDGAYVVFSSEASNLVPGDAEGQRDVFLYETASGQLERVTTGANGPSIVLDVFSNAQGVSVLFVSAADNLVVGDNNSLDDLFFYHLQSNISSITRISIDSSGNEANGPSSFIPVVGRCFFKNGRGITFNSLASNLVANDINGFQDIFLHDLDTQMTILASQATGGPYLTTISGESNDPAISANGRYVVYASLASNLILGDIEGQRDIFLHDFSTGTTTRISEKGGIGGNGDSSTPVITPDGRYVVFASLASNLVAGDTEGQMDVFYHDTQTGITKRISEVGGIGGNGGSSNPAVSADGRYVVYTSWASNLVANDIKGQWDIFLHDVQNGTTTRITEIAGVGGNGGSDFPAISADGRYIVYESWASNLVAGDNEGQTDIFLYDTQTGSTKRISEIGGTGGNGASLNPTISASGRFIGYASRSGNLVLGDNEGQWDVFLYDVQTGGTRRISEIDGAGGDADSDDPMISTDGRFIAYQSRAGNLVPNDGNGKQDIFLYDTLMKRTTRISENNGQDHNGNSCRAPALSAKGLLTVFACNATNLTEDQVDGQDKVFLFTHEVIFHDGMESP